MIELFDGYHFIFYRVLCRPVPLRLLVPSRMFCGIPPGSRLLPRRVLLVLWRVLPLRRLALSRGLALHRTWSSLLVHRRTLLHGSSLPLRLHGRLILLARSTLVRIRSASVWPRHLTRRIIGWHLTGWILLHGRLAGVATVTWGRPASLRYDQRTSKQQAWPGKLKNRGSETFWPIYWILLAIFFE